LLKDIPQFWAKVAAMPIRRVAYVIARFEVEADVGDIDFTDEHLLILEDAHGLNPGQI